MNVEMFKLSAELDSRRFMANEWSVDPRHSTSNEVRRIWTDVTAPHRLQELLEWEKSNSPLNPTAQELVTMAIAQAKYETAGQ